MHRFTVPELPKRFNSHEDLAVALEPLLSDLEAKLASV